MFDRIVVGTDGSETAGEAVRQAIELARRRPARASRSSAPTSRCRRSRLREEADEIPATSPTRSGRRRTSTRSSRRPPARRKQAGVEVATHAREGGPADAILDVAEQTKADLIVVGNKGMTGARRFLLGSVPNNISHHAPCSVLIVRTT